MSSKVACLYIRVSTEDQTELSPDAQKRLLLDYAQKNDMIVSGDFIFTESVSGRHAQKRPEFQKMIALAKQPSHPIDVRVGICGMLRPSQPFPPIPGTHSGTVK